VRVWSASVAHARAFATREAARHGIAIEAMETARAAVEGADLICTVTAAKSPVLNGEWIAEGAHVNAVGACFPAARVLDTAAVLRSRLFVDRRESTLAESGDFLIPKQEGALDERHIRAELGEVLSGAAVGRERPTDVTLFKSLGLAVEDLAAAHHVAARASEKNVGLALDLGGRRRG
jgi:ornithine cyclodeaminase